MGQRTTYPLHAQPRRSSGDSPRQTIHYVRVSTNEQGEQYSPAAQRDILEAHDRRLGYACVASFFDDKSAKEGAGLTEAFDRRKDFMRMLAWVKATPCPDAQGYLLEFKDWTRFTRDVTAGLVMIKRLRKMGVECQAVTQPVDWSIPEQRFLPVLYMTTGEIDNARRSINIIQGTRRALKEGRWCNAAPLGYERARDDRGKPYVRPSA